MSTANTKQPRRVRVERNIYRRPDGKLEVGYRDSASKQRWKGPFETITAARRQRDALLGAKAKGDRVEPAPRLTFGAAADRWLAEQVTQLRETTQANYRNSIETHLKPRWATRRIDQISVDDCARLVRELRAAGKAESTIATILRAANRVFKFARRRCGWRGENPLSLLEAGERPRLGDAPERRIYRADELNEVLAASTEPWTTLFLLAAVVGGRVSELLGLRWADVDLSDPNRATIRFTHQVDRHGRRVELKTEESKATLPLPSGVALMLEKHKACTPDGGPRSFVFATRTGRPLSQRNVLRALYRAQARAIDPEGRPTFPELFEHDAHGHLVQDAGGAYVLLRMPRRKLPALPDFHALRHGAAMECDDAEEARDLLRHKNSNVTRAVYRAHFSDKRREALRARMEARMEAANRNSGRQPATPQLADVLQTNGFDDTRR